MDLKKRVFSQIVSSYRDSDLAEHKFPHFCSLFEALMVQGASACVSFTISMDLRKKKTSFSLYHHHQIDGEKKKKKISSLTVTEKVAERNSGAFSLYNLAASFLQEENNKGMKRRRSL